MLRSEVGMQVGEFQLERPLGAGGMGAVWRGRHGPSGTPVAVKLLSKLEPVQLEGFEREIRATAGLDHPAIARVFDHGRVTAKEASASGGTLTEGAPWFAMELCSRGLAELAPRMAWAELVPILLTVLDALAHAHARGVLHRDMKTDNVLVASADDLRPGPKLVDFGIASLLDESTGTTEAGGTPRYMAPEQLQDRDGLLGPWTDLYGVGMIAWRIVSGRLPYREYKGPELFEALVAGPPVWHGARQPVPDGAVAWILRMTAHDPANRFRWASDAARALRDVVGLEPPAVADGEATTVRLGAVGLGLLGVRRPALVGRREERARLGGWLADAGTSGPGAVRVSGDPGTGRGRLIDAVGEAAEAAGRAQMVRCRFSDDEPPGASVIDGLRRRLRVFDGDLAEARDRVRFWTGDDDLADALGPVLAAGATLDPSWPAGAVSLVRALAVDRPVLLALHDPPAAVEPFVRAVVDSGARVLVAWAGGALGGVPHHEIALERLPVADLSALARSLVPLSHDGARRAAVAADGSPAYLVDLLTHWARQGWLVPGPTGCTVAPGAAAPATSSVLAQVRMEAVLHGLPAGARDALELAGALGPTVDRRLWVELCPDADARLALLERLLDDGSLREAPGGWRFTRRVFFEAVVRGTRDAPAWHRRIASALMARRGPSQEIGHHLLEAGDGRAALQPLLDGIIDVADRSGPEAAVVVLDRMEEVARTLEGREATWWACAIDDRRANFLKALDPAGARAAAARAEALLPELGDRDLTALVHSRFGAFALMDGDVREGASRFARALATADHLPMFRLAYWHAERGRALAVLGDEAGRLYHLREAWRCAMADPGHERAWFEPLNAAQYALADGRVADALHHADRLEVRATTLGSLLGRFHGARTRGDALVASGQREAAREAFVRAARLGRMLGFVHHVGDDVLKALSADLAVERWDRAEALFEAFRDLLPPGHDHAPRFASLHLCGLVVECRRHGWDRAWYHLDRLDEVPRLRPEGRTCRDRAATAAREAGQDALSHGIARVGEA